MIQENFYDMFKVDGKEPSPSPCGSSAAAEDASSASASSGPAVDPAPPEGGGGPVKASPQVREVLPVYRRLSRAGVVLWFIRRNFLSLFSRLLLVSLFIWLFFLGGFVWCLNSFIGVFRHTAASGAGSSPVEVSSIDQAGSGSSETSPELKIPSSPSSEVSSESSPVVENTSSGSAKENDSVYLTLVMPDKVYTNYGDILKVGDIINEDSNILKGSESGQTVYVVSINYRDCCVKLSNGLVLRMLSH